MNIAKLNGAVRQSLPRHMNAAAAKVVCTVLCAVKLSRTEDGADHGALHIKVLYVQRVVFDELPTRQDAREDFRHGEERMLAAIVLDDCKERFVLGPRLPSLRQRSTSQDAS